MKKQQKDRIIKRAIKFIKENTNDNAQRSGAAIIEELRIVKNLTIPVVIQQSEQLIAFLDYLEESEGAGETIVDRQAFVDGFLKAIYSV